MRLCRFYNTFFVLISLHHTCITALPQRALNLHQNLSPHDVNGLTKEQRVAAALDVETTIAEVQKLLALDPTLPRLTKGEIQELFEKATKNELEKSITNGNKERIDYMKRILQFLPYHKKEISTLEQLSQLIVTTEVPASQPETPKELQKLLKQYGLLDTEGKPVEIAPLPLAISASDPKSILRFGELPSASRVVKPISSSTSVIKPEDYVSFKPLKPLRQANATSSADIESILKHFGLANSEKLTSSSAKKVKIVKPSADSNDSSYHQMISSYSSLLENMGIPVPPPKSSKTPAVNRGKTKNHGNTDDYKNLQHLLDTIKELEKLNTTLTAKEVDKLNLKNFNFSESLLKNGPDPVLYQNHFSALKNEVKRRQSGFGDGKGPTPLLESSLEANEDDIGEAVASTTARAAPKRTTTRASSIGRITTTARPTTTTTTTTTERTTTTTEAEEVESSTQERKNTLEDELEPVDDPAPLPPPRRSGFYMLVDWNSFFEVGEDENKIKVRFDPKIGDPSRFLPVTIP